MTVEFDGTGYLDIGNAADLNFERTDPFSMLFRVRPAPTASTTWLYCKSDNAPGWRGVLVGIDSGGQLLVQMINDWAGSNRLQKNAFIGGTYDHDMWTNWLFTYDGTSNTSGINIYKEGALLATTTPYNTLSATILTTGTAMLGRRIDNTVYSGFMDECAVWDKELSLAEVETVVGSYRNIPNLQSVGPSGNLVEYWKNGEGATYPTIPGEIGGNDATMTSMVAGDLTWDGSSGTVFTYKMRALQDPGPGYYYWVNTGSADFLGTNAPGTILAGTAVVVAIVGS